MYDLSQADNDLSICQESCQRGGTITMETMLEVIRLLESEGGAGEMAAESLIDDCHDLSYGDMRAVIRYLKSQVAQ